MATNIFFEKKVMIFLRIITKIKFNTMYCQSKDCDLKPPLSSRLEDRDNEKLQITYKNNYRFLKITKNFYFILKKSKINQKLMHTNNKCYSYSNLVTSTKKNNNNKNICFRGKIFNLALILIHFLMDHLERERERNNILKN